MSVEIKSFCALRKTGAALLAVQFTLSCGALAQLAIAHPGHESEQCEPKVSREKSIVISEKKISDDDSASTESSESDEGNLKPIAKVSKNEPELAEPLTTAMVPTLAEPLPTKGKKTSTESTKELARSIVQLGEFEAISFHGITPGISKRINVLRQWGDPRSDDTQAAELKYRFDDLPAVRVRFEDNRVTSILVELQKPMPVASLTRKLNLRQVRPAMLRDSDGTTLSQIYPERGVTLNFAADEAGLAIASDGEASGLSAPRIESIVIQPIEAGPFMLRAADNADSNFNNAIVDLKAAVRLDSSLAEARNQLSEIYLSIGKAVTAETHAAESVDLEPDNADYRLQWAKCLRKLARYDRAVEQVRQVLETPSIAPLSRAKALNEMGLLASLGNQKVARRAMPLHAKAIEIADSLAVGEDLQISLEAKQLLVEAHLDVAVEISRGAWSQKDEAVPEWIERASALSEALIEEDASYLPLRLQVAVSSLAAAANLEQPINPLLWIEEAEETVAEIKTEIYDPLTASQYEWQLGLAYFHGSQIEHRRSEPESSLHLGELADQQLLDLAKGRDEMPDTAYLLGRLYFQIGAVHAVHFEDHLSACEWYDVAIDRLLNPVPVTTVAAPQQHGDALVSMGVSYWNQADHQRAIEVTKSGVELIETAVSSGLLERETLMVSYNNLAAMYEAQGDKEPAARYERLAKQITGSKLSQKPKAGRNSRR